MESRKTFDVVGAFNLRPSIEFVNIIGELVASRSTHSYMYGIKFADVKQAEKHLGALLTKIKKQIIESENTRPAFTVPEQLLSAKKSAEEEHLNAQNEIQNILSGKKKEELGLVAKKLNEQRMLKRQDSKVKLTGELADLQKRIKINNDELIAAKAARMKLQLEIKDGKLFFKPFKKKETTNPAIADLDKRVKSIENRLKTLNEQMAKACQAPELDEIEKSYAEALSKVEEYENIKKDLLEAANKRFAQAMKNLEDSHTAIHRAEDEYYGSIKPQNMHGLVALYEAFTAYVTALDNVKDKTDKLDQFVKLLRTKKSEVDDLMSQMYCSQLGKENVTTRNILDRVHALSPVEQTQFLVHEPSAAMVKNLFTAPVSVGEASIFKRMSADATSTAAPAPSFRLGN